MAEKTVKNYELYFILSPEMSNDEVGKEVEKIETLIKKNLKVEEIEVNKEGLKKLAYPIKKHTTGFYVLMNFDVNYTDSANMQEVEKGLNLSDNVVRFIVVDQTDYLKLKSQEKLNEDSEIKEHRELNKGAGKDKKCVSNYLGIKAVDYKDTEYLEQFTSPYAKIFGRKRTGSSAKMQRKITKAIKRARHMALMPFTPNYED